MENIEYEEDTEHEEFGDDDLEFLEEIERNAGGLNSDNEELDDFLPENYSISYEKLNIYMELITNRSPDTVYAFNTEFYINLSKNGYNEAKKHTEKIDIFSKHKLFIPAIFEEKNLCGLVYVNFIQKFIKYYDNLGGQNLVCLKLIMNFLISEFLDKKKKRKDFHPKDWLLINVNDLPRQDDHKINIAFVCKCAEYLSRDAPLDFTLIKLKRMFYQINSEIDHKKLTRPISET
ncbi:sentrin-specific protease 1-like [Melanaphis sacchari]|uniref:sentrin-specific protease 1-like n=1 Tax=Melanaphis sacchari TaxID=742174 RepID=UPI000DC13CC0|nr:sentrin-specific protease 1-like [Melanaphis sacchari]